MPNNYSDVFGIGTSQTISTSATSALLTNAFGSATRAVRLVATAACHVKMGNPTATATTSDPLLPANVPWFIQVAPGQKIAAIQNAAAGVLHVTELT